MTENKKGAGRPKGSLNKRNQSVIDKLDKLKCDPIEGMAKIADRAIKGGDLQLAGSMYKELAQYVACKRKAIELSNEEGSGPLVIQWKS